jgi:hypothetical protein
MTSHRPLLTNFQIQFSSKVAEMILQKVVGRRSLSVLVSKSQFGIAELNENHGLQKCNARLRTIS